MFVFIFSLARSRAPYPGASGELFIKARSLEEDGNRQKTLTPLSQYLTEATHSLT